MLLLLVKMGSIRLVWFIDSYCLQHWEVCKCTVLSHCMRGTCSRISQTKEKRKEGTAHYTRHVLNHTPKYVVRGVSYRQLIIAITSISPPRPLPPSSFPPFSYHPDTPRSLPNNNHKHYIPLSLPLSRVCPNFQFHISSSFQSKKHSS